MDQDAPIKKPKYAEYYKNPEQRKMYQRRYQLDRYHRNKALASAGQGGVMETKQIVPSNTAGSAPVDQLTSALNALTETLGPDDGVTKFIKKVQPFVPLATAFIQGFVQNMNAAQAQTQQAPVLQPPEGWTYLSGIEKLKRKYNSDGSLSSWYLAGEYYDQQMAIRGIGPGVQSGMPIPMEHTIHGQREAAIQRRNQEMAQAQQRTMRDLEREAQQFDKKAQDTQDMATAQEVSRSDGAPTTINEALEAKESSESQENGSQLTGEQAKQIVKEITPKLQEDAIKYLNLVVNYFKTREIKQFENDLKNVDEMIKQYSGFIDLLPFQAKESFKRIKAEELEGMLKEADPEKHKMIVKKKLKSKLFKLWDELKARL